MRARSLRNEAIVEPGREKTYIYIYIYIYIYREMERDREREQEGIIKTVCKENNINTIENEKAVKPHTRIRTHYT